MIDLLIDIDWFSLAIYRYIQHGRINLVKHDSKDIHKDFYFK